MPRNWESPFPKSVPSTLPSTVLTTGLTASLSVEWSSTVASRKQGYSFNPTTTIARKLKALPTQIHTHTRVLDVTQLEQKRQGRKQVEAALFGNRQHKQRWPWWEKRKATIEKGKARQHWSWRIPHEQPQKSAVTLTLVSNNCTSVTNCISTQFKQKKKNNKKKLKTKQTTTTPPPPLNKPANNTWCAQRKMLFCWSIDTSLSVHRYFQLGTTTNNNRQQPTTTSNN